MDKGDVLDIIKNRAKLADTKREEPPIKGWGRDEWRVYWDGQYRCAMALANEINSAYNKSLNAELPTAATGKSTKPSA